LIVSLGLGLNACGNSRPASEANDIDMGSGKNPEMEDGGAAPAPSNAPANDPAPQSSPASDPNTVPKPGGGSAPSSGAPSPG
jgi:hypothetical protein